MGSLKCLCGLRIEKIRSQLPESSGGSGGGWWCRWSGWVGWGVGRGWRSIRSILFNWWARNSGDLFNLRRIFQILPVTIHHVHELDITSLDNLFGSNVKKAEHILGMVLGRANIDHRRTLVQQFTLELQSLGHSSHSTKRAQRFKLGPRLVVELMVRTPFLLLGGGHQLVCNLLDKISSLCPEPMAQPLG